MKIWTRITLATSAVVALALGVYALLELGRGQAERRRLLEREAREVALVVRASVESRTEPLTTERAAALGKALSSADRQVAVTIVPLRAANTQASAYTRGQLERLETVVAVRPRELRTVGKSAIVITLPLRTLDDKADDGYRITGTVEAKTSLAVLHKAWLDDLKRIIPVSLVVLGLMIVAILVFIRRLVTQPIQKLIAGMDDVAQGDLSRVLLSEREDEIGQLAARFNEMTTSLRESREETQRQNDARHHLEEQLSQTEKLATIGQLAAEIAHEVGTPLNVIAGRARSLGKKASDPNAIAKNSEIIAEQASRITRIIQRLLDFARRKVGTVDTEIVDLNRVASTTMDFLESKLAGARVGHELSCQRSLPEVKGHPDQLQQVLINLILNAVDAAGEGGRVTVETAAVTRRRPGLELEAKQTFIVVSVTDTGPGIPADVRDKIFEPFYTSKEGRGGTGLGLAVSFGIIKDHDGWIEVDDAASGGTVFRVYVPSAQSSATGPHKSIEASVAS